MQDHTAPAPTWTCPFCPLLCDHLTVQAGTAAQPFSMAGADSCARAHQALAHFNPGRSAAQPMVNGQACTLNQAVQAAAQVLRTSRQPLFAGLGCDVAGARALQALASRCGAIADAANGSSFLMGLRALQDRGAFTTTLAEVRNRADLIVCVGGLPLQRQPLLLQRCGIGQTDLVPQRRLVLLGGEGELPAHLQSTPGLSVDRVPLAGDLFDTLSLLAARVAGAGLPQAASSPALDALAQQLLAARYSVLVWEGASLPRHGALIVEALNRIVGTLNRSTRSSTLPLGGGDGAATANQVWAWLSGLPLRTRTGPAGLEHEPLRYDAATLLADGAADSLLWVSAFGPNAWPAARPGLPLVVLGHPALAAQMPVQMPGQPHSVFIPVCTPGIGAAGHLFRTDGVVLMPLHAVQDDGLPGVAEVARQIHQALQALPAGAAA